MCMRAHITPMKTLTKRDLTARFSMASSEIPVSSKIQVSLGIWIHLVFLFILLKSRPCFYLKRLCFCKNTFHLKGNIKKKKEKAPANAGDARDTGSVPGSGRSPGVGNGNPLQYSCLENSMDRRAWGARVHGVSKSRTGLSSSTLSVSSILFSPVLCKC